MLALQARLGRVAHAAAGDARRSAAESLPRIPLLRLRLTCVRAALCSRFLLQVEVHPWPKPFKVPVELKDFARDYFIGLKITLPKARTRALELPSSTLRDLHN